LRLRQREVMMMKMIIISVLTFVLSVAFGTVAGAEMAKDGEGSYVSGQSGTLKVLPMEKERLQMNYDTMGVVVEAPADSPLYNATFHALGGLHAIKGVYEDRGFVVWTRPDGDKVFATYEATGKVGVGGVGRKCTFSFVGGTGKCAGIQGGGEYTGVGPVRASAKGTFQGISKGRFHWKMP